MRKSLSAEAWTVRAVGAGSNVPTAVAETERGAKIPGCVHTDLMRAGLLGDPNVGFNEHEQRWVGNTDWRYRCEFDADADMLAHERVDLVCEGLDTIATISLNGTVLGSAANMHHRHRFDARPALSGGRNELVIDFGAPLAHVREQERQRGKRPLNGDWGPYPFVRKMASNFGWDWGPMVPTVGIWRDIYLHAWNTVRIASVSPLIGGPGRDGDWTVNIHVALEHASNVAQPPIRTPDASSGLSSGAHEHQSTEDSPTANAVAGVQDTCTGRRTVRAEARGSSLRAVARVDLTDSSGAVASVDVAPGCTEATVTLTVRDPRLWWPAGYGDQHLYVLNVRVEDDATDTPETLDAWSARIGFRTIRLSTDADEHGSAFTLEVNGRPIFCKGANWIPEGMFPSALTPEIYRERVRQARDANMNMLRVWGGGIYEDSAFYDACDEFGILVWQDFMFACATYPEEEPYATLIEAEARHNIARLSKHPSVALWCGGNECIWAYKSWGFGLKLKRGQTWGRRYYLDLLPRLMAELDATRPYWPNSPYSGTFDADPLDPDHGNRHTWDMRGEDYRRLVPRFVSEFGHQSPPTMATLRESWPSDGFAVDSEVMRHRQRAAGGNKRQYTQPIEQWFRKPTDFDEWHYLAQLTQVRAVTLAIEWWRAHMPRCMGVLYWQFNDCWAGHSWSAIDCAGRLKPLWHATRRAYAPRLLTIQPVRKRPRLFVVNDSDEPWQATIAARRMSMDGASLAEAQVRLDVGPRARVDLADLNKLIGKATDTRGEFVIAEADGLRAMWFFEKDRKLCYPAPRYSSEVTKVDGTWRLEVRAETLLRDLTVTDSVVGAAGENVVTLLPGETASVEIDSAHTTQCDSQSTPPVLWCANLFGAA